MDEKQIFAGSLRVNYAEGPVAGPPLVLLHGGSARWQQFESLIPAFSDRWHVLAPDLRGHGRSAWTPGHYTLQDYADDLKLFLPATLTQPAYLFGLSLGGQVALMSAARAPALVKAVAIGDSHLDQESFRRAISSSNDRLSAWRELAGGKRPITEVIEALKDAPIEAPGGRPTTMREVFGEENPVFAWLASNLAGHDPAMLDQLLSDIDAVVVGYDMASLLPAIRCPLLLLQADPECGGVMTDAEVKRATSLVPELHHVKLIGAAHNILHDAPDGVLAALIEFFAQVEPAT